jgi:uncharacterized protein
MKTDDLQELINYRLRRSLETLEEAHLMEEIEHWNACANRLYYAAFYAVSALVIRDGHTASKHSGIKAIFNKYYIKPGTMTRDCGRLYNRLFDLRQEGDYIDFINLKAETIKPLIGETTPFIEKIKLHLNIQQLG